VAYRVDGSRGLDHGAWTLLRHIYPEADVPVVAMSVNANLAPAEQYRIGQALAQLRARDVMVIGSGVTVHNFGTINWKAPAGVPDAWAKEFDDWVFDKLTRWDTTALFAYETQAPHAQKAVPPHGNEHFVPLFYTMGAACETPSVKELHRHYEFGNLSYVLWQFGA
jgi:4,5-DOPA dioxygenase extradiol